MSYCRFSSNNFDCDLYCYEDCYGGFTTHVAGNRIKGVSGIPKLPPIERGNWKEYDQAYKKQMAWLETAEHEEIGLEFDGMRFNDPDLESFLARVKSLKEAGYHVPDFVISSIEHEISHKENI